MKITRGTEDIKTLIPFMNKVFRKNFPRLLPKLYTSNKYACNHYHVEENGKLIGAIASIPNVLHVNNDTLSAYGVGMVSCHPRHRGKGVMSTMLTTIIADAKREGADFMYLDGNRQRYQYFGFYPAGYQYTFTLTPPNFKHMREDMHYTFIPLREDSEELSKVIEIYNAEAVRYEREDFLKTMHSWNIKKVYAIKNSTGNVIGHLAYKWATIVDIVTTEPQNTAYIVKAFASNHTKFFGRVRLFGHQVRAIESMSKYAQTSSLSESTQFKILNYRHVVEVLLRMQANSCTLPDMTINVEIADVETFSVTIKNNTVITGNVLEGVRTYSYSESNATLYLFSPTLSQMSGLPFVLPLFTTTVDNV